MAKHFATLDDNNVVTSIFITDDEACPTDGDAIGEQYCINLKGPGNYKQYSPTGSFRKQAAQIGGHYAVADDVFVQERPHASWMLDANHDWQAPIAYPNITAWGESDDVYPINWDEVNQRWTGTSREGQEFLVWNGSAWSA
tara:strand:- start:14375 stop:14797 length:423 start_codon:yes stop_codon:yes gene_type:complete